MSADSREFAPLKDLEEEHSRVLFVDDDPNVTRAMKVALRKEPYEILTAGSGQEALEILETRRCAVVVSDERMPGMSGAELLARVRERHPDTIRIVLTGQASVDAAMQAINQAQVWRFLMKPCAPEDLALCLSSALEERGRRMRYDGWRATRSESKALGLQDAFTRALDTSYMVFQPIIRAHGGEVYGYECLVRCSDPEISQPGTLIGLAEDLGQVADLDRHIHRLIADGIPGAPAGVQFLVNLHPDSLSDEGMFERGGPLDAHAGRVVLEVTERCALKSTDELHGKLDELRERGFRIALDDLGAGYAGLSSFALLSPNVVKLDMGLIRAVHESPTRCKLIQSMTTLCRELDILTIAEGVETEQECNKVVELGCDLLQGYLLAPPSREFAGSKQKRLAG